MVILSQFFVFEQPESADAGLGRIIPTKVNYNKKFMFMCRQKKKDGLI